MLVQVLALGKVLALALGKVLALALGKVQGHRVMRRVQAPDPQVEADARAPARAVRLSS